MGDRHPIRRDPREFPQQRSLIGWFRQVVQEAAAGHQGEAVVLEGQGKGRSLQAGTSLNLLEHGRGKIQANGVPIESTQNCLQASRSAGCVE